MHLAIFFHGKIVAIVFLLQITFFTTLIVSVDVIALILESIYALKSSCVQIVLKDEDIFQSIHLGQSGTAPIHPQPSEIGSRQV